MSFSKNQKRLVRGKSFQKSGYGKASSISSCLNDLKSIWRAKRNNVGLWNDWAQLAGEQLAANCQPLSFKRGILIIGASHPQWRQALQYNRTQLIATIRTAGYEIKDIRIQQYHPEKVKKRGETEQSIWEKHPSRIDIHGLATCQSCGSPAPAGEISLWGKCCFCRRKGLF